MGTHLFWAVNDLHAVAAILVLNRVSDLISFHDAARSIVGTVSALLPIMLAVQMFDGISGATSGDDEAG